MISVSNSNYKKYLRTHCDAILDYCSTSGSKFGKTKLDSAIQLHFGKVVSDLESLLEAPPDILFEIKEAFESKTLVKRTEVLMDLDLIGLYNYFVNKEGPFKRGTERYNSDYLAEQIDIKTCPYCNENTTYSFWHNKKNHLRRTYDWDHILPKDIYPFLAVSFFNLVPGCKVCNHLKLTQPIDISPHHNFDPDAVYTFYLDGTLTGFIDEATAFDLLLEVHRDVNGAAVKNVIDILSLDTRYAQQRELMIDIVNKKRIYMSAFWDDLTEFVRNNGGMSAGDLKKMFFSAYFNSEDYFRRPFSKLTRDLLHK
jgi:hypothetical protein